MAQGSTMFRQRSRGPQNPTRDVDQIMKSLGTLPRILCWNCRQLTSFELDRCQHCGSASEVMFQCPECGSSVPSGEDWCPVCRVEFRAASLRDHLVYSCPRCGTQVDSDAIRCSCGAWFEE